MSRLHNRRSRLAIFGSVFKFYHRDFWGCFSRRHRLVWNPGAGSTTTLADLNVLSLQGIANASGGSFHVNPMGEPDAEVEVSNGASTGGGTIQYGKWVAPSSRRFKTKTDECEYGHRMG